MARQAAKSQIQFKAYKDAQKLKALEDSTRPRRDALCYAGPLPANLGDKNCGKENTRSKTVSISGIFKQSKNASRGKKYREVKFEEAKSKPKPDWAVAFGDAYEVARKGARKLAEEGLAEVHKEFTERLSSARARDAKFYESLSQDLSTLNMPIADEEIEISWVRNEQREFDIGSIGARFALFTKKTEEDEASLAHKWVLWNSLQTDFLTLGASVFGNQLFPGGVKGQDQQGYKKDMEVLNMEHNTSMEALSEEVKNIGDKAMERTRNSEKELHNRAKQDQALLFASLMDE